MQQQINDLITRINDLEKLINTIQQNIYFDITIFVALITITATIIGGALKIITRAWVEKKVEEELVTLKKEHNDFIFKIEEKYKELDKIIDAYMDKYENKVYLNSTQYASRNDLSVKGNGLFGAIDNLIDLKIKNTKFNYTETAIIKRDNGDGTYEVSYNRPIRVLQKCDDGEYKFINQDTTTLPAINEMKYNVNDIAYIEIVNNDYSFRYIKCKKPERL